MKTGIIVYSNTGNTLQAARRLQEAMKGKGQEAELLQVRAGNEKPETDVSRVRLTEKPSPEGFDRLVFASPVWGFSLSGVMKAYLAGLPPLEGKKIGLYVTHHFPLPWMGGNTAVKQMKKLCEEKGGTVVSSAVISWNEKRRERDILEMLGKLS